MLMLVCCAAASAAYPLLRSQGLAISVHVYDAPFVALQVRNLDGSAGPQTISWPQQVVGTSWQGAPECLELTVHTTGYMTVQIYTNNITTGPCLGVTFSTGTNTCVPVGWIISSNPVAPASFGEPGDSTVLNPVVCSTGTVSVPWHRLQDKNDCTTAINLLSGTAPVMYSIDNLQMSSSANIMQKEYVYFEGDFSFSNAGETYATTIYVDLISQ